MFTCLYPPPIEMICFFSFKKITFYHQKQLNQNLRTACPTKIIKQSFDTHDFSFAIYSMI